MRGKATGMDGRPQRNIMDVGGIDHASRLREGSGIVNIMMAEARMIIMDEEEGTKATTTDIREKGDTDSFLYCQKLEKILVFPISVLYSVYSSMLSAKYHLVP